MSIFVCTSCGLPYPESGLPHQCPGCGGVFGIERLEFLEKAAIQNALPGIWRYRSAFGLPGNANMVYLGEGGTPLVGREVARKRVFFKLENLNPTGSFKDRGSALLVSFMLSRGVTEVVEDSSGNAGASLAAYAAAVGIKSHIFVPSFASGPKLQQMQAYGARVVRVPGAREAAHQAALSFASERGLPYASHALLPMGIPGIASTAFELIEQLGQMPGSIVAPIGHGSLFLGLILAVRAIRAQQPGASLPVMVGAQPANCAPLVANWEKREFGGCQGSSLAEGTQIETPVRARQILSLLDPSRDALVAITEDELLSAWQALAKMGFYVEPTSALVWAACDKLIDDLPEPVVLVFSGSGLKFSQQSIK